MFDKLLLISCICIVVALILNFFFWNRFIALMIGLSIRVLYWNQEASSIWVEIGAIHFSLLTGRILLKDFRYHSSNQTIKVVKGEIQWRYWIRRPTTEEDIDTLRGEDQKRLQKTSSCRIQLSMEGFEWFIYNRTTAYDSIISQMDDLHRPISRTSQKDRRETTSPFVRPSQRRALRVPMTIQNAMTWLRLQLPHLDPKDLLPLGLDVSKGAIILGNLSTPNLTVAEFRSAEGTFGIAPSRSKYDLYKQILSLKFQLVSGRLVPNTDFVDTMGTLGELLHNRVKQDPTLGRASSFLSYRSFTKLWRQMKLYTATTRYYDIRREQWTAQQSIQAPSYTATKSKVVNEAETPVGTNFSNFEYAIERKIFEAPVLELSYYVDVVGDVSGDLDSNELNSIDVGNGDTAPEWGFDFVFHGGFLKYGPWADRQRSELQRAFFPATYQKAEVLARLQPGDKRVWTAMHVFIELRDETTLHIPFREASKDWQWDGLADVPQRQRKRESASLNVMVGDRSSIKYIMPIVAMPSGYESTLEVHLDTILVTSSLNDIRLVSAESCRVRCELPSPLKWNDERTWDIAVFLRQPVLYLLRDHMNMFTDLGKDWASGPLTDWYKFIPMIYTVKFEMHHYELNLYANDQNIIDKPLIKEENALIITRGPYIKSEVKIPLNIFRAESTTVSFSVSSTDLSINILLPRWNTHALHAPKDGHSLLKAGLYKIEGSYLYFPHVREDNIDQLKLIMTLRNSVYKATGWSIRYFMVLRDNYIGSFTHFSTLYEYLDKRRRNLPVGDPIVMKYRKGKNNILHVDLTVDIRDNIVLQPAGLLAYELSDKDELKHELRTGPCLVLFVPSIQLQLRLHDYYMEMSLNIDAVRGRMEKNYPEKVLFTKMSPSTKEIILIDGVDIVANRLFGPQPRTATYICLWEIRVGHVKAALSTSDGNLLAAAGNSFRLNFVDSANAPAKNYQLPFDPDVTFYKVSVAAVDTTWRAGHAALTLSCPEGINIDTNDLGTRFYRKVTSLRIPSLHVRILLNRSPERNPWLEAAEVLADVFLDFYFAPEGFQEMVQAQSKFVEDQDKGTGRSQRMFASVRQRTVKQEHICHLNGLHLPHSRLPSPSTGFQSNGQYKAQVPGQPTTWRSSKALVVLESDGEEGVSEADRDARLAQTRVLTPIPLFGNEEDMSSGDESDDADLTDGDSSDSDWSDVADPSNLEPNDSLLDYYSHLTRHYLPSPQGAPHLWEGPSFILTRERSPLGLSNFHSGIMEKGQAVSLNHSGRPETISTTLRVHLKRSIEIKITPLILPSLGYFENDIMTIEHSPELCVESLIMGCLSRCSSPKSPHTSTLLDFWLPSVAIHCLQHVPFVDEDYQPPTTKDGPRAKLDVTAVIEIGLKGLRMTANLTKLHPLLNASIQQFDLRLNMSLNKRTLLAVSPRSSIFDFSLTAVKAGFKYGHLDFSLGAVSTEVGNHGPELLTAALIAFTQNAVQLVDTLKRLKEHNTTVIHNIVCDIIKISGKKAIIDPLSTIQPSYLIQSGIPHRLRTDISFRFLFHLRNCLWNIDEHERHQLNVSLKNLESIPLDRFVALLKSRLAAVDQEVYNDTSLSPLVPIFPALLVQGSRGVQPSVIPTDFNSVALQITKVDVSIRGPSVPTSNRLTLTDLAVNTRIRALEVVHFSTKDVAGLSQTSLRRNPPRVMKQVSATISLGDVTLTIYPHLMRFVQRVLRVRKQYELVGVKRNKMEQPSPKSSQLFSYVTLFSLRHLRVQAAAENFIFEIGVVGTHATSSLLTAKLQKTLATNHSLFFEQVYLQARAPSDSTKQSDQNVLASLAFTGGQLSAATLEAQTSKTNTRLVFSLQSLHLNVPRSAIRLYYYIEEWRADFLPGIEATVQAILSELKETPRRSVSPNSSRKISKDISVQIHGKIEQLKVSLQVMHGTWLSWEINNILGYNNSSSGSASVLIHDFGVQLGSLIMNIASTPQAQDILPSPHIRLVLPPLSVSGNYNGSRVRTLVLMEFVELKVKPSHWDTLLAVQQKFGQDFNDLVTLMQESRLKRAPSSPSKSYSGDQNLRFEGSLKIRGFRIGLEGLSSTIYLECLDINGDLSNEAAGVTWEIALSDVALSLASRASGRYDQGFNRGHRSAFVIIDFKVNGTGSDDKRVLTKALRLSVTKIHAVMQPSSIGQIGDFIDHMQAEVLDRKERRSHELAAFKEKTQQILKTFDVNIGDTQVDENSWMNEYFVNVSIYNIGVAFPLALDQDLELPLTGISASAVRAFLFSIKTIEFGIHRGETGQASMKSFSFQFVPRFRQSIPSDFAADSHQTRNRLVYPEMEAQLRTVNSGSSRQILISANVSGFILDLDSSIPDYVFSLVDVYRQGKDRVEKLASVIARTPSSATSASGFTKLPSEKNYSALPTSNVFGNLTFLSGKVRVYSGSATNLFRSRSLSIGVHEMSDEQVLDLGAEVFNLPVVSVWAEYRAVPAAQKLPFSRDQEPSILMFKSTVHSSQNTLRPTLLPFLTELVSHVETRLRKISSRILVPPPVSTPLLPIGVTSRRDEGLEAVSSMQISFSLRIDRSRLELTCQPDVNVIAGLHWDSGGFIVNMTPGAKIFSFTGSVGGLTIGLKHGFLSEDCVKLDARNLAFSVSFTKLESPSGGASSSISIILDTEFLGGVRFSRLQDILCFKAVWLDRFPIINQSQNENSTPTKVDTPVSYNQQQSRGLSTAVLVRIRQIKLDIDLGQSISAISLDLRHGIMRTKLTDAFNEVSVFVGEVEILAKGNLSGHARVPDCVFQTVRRAENVASDSSGRKHMLELRLTSGTLVAELESDHQKLLYYRAEPLKVEIIDDWSMISPNIENGDRPLQLSFTVASPEVTAVATVGTVPKIQAYINKFNANLNVQRQGASRESATFRTTRSPKPDNPLSAVAEAMLYSARTRLKEAETGLSYVIKQHMSLRLSMLRLVIFPRTMNDLELAQFIGQDVSAILDRFVASKTQSPRKDLHLAFSSMTISKFTRVNHLTLALPTPPQDEQDGREWLSSFTRDASEANIVGLPSMKMHMVSDEIEEGGTDLVYDFHSEFVRREGNKAFEDIYITLNVSLYSWLTILRKNVQREMEQVRAAADWRATVTAGTVSPALQRKKATDLAAASETSKSATLQSPGPFSVPSPQPNHTELISPIPFPSLKETDDVPQKRQGITYRPRNRHIERLTMRQLGEATPDVMHPFFMKKAGFNLEDSLPQYVNEYATTPLEEILNVLLTLYSRQLLGATPRT